MLQHASEQRLVLTEYRTSDPVRLTLDHLAALRNVRGLSLDVTPASPGQYTLTAGATVGAVALPGLQFIIRPKIPVSRVMFLLSYAIDRVSWSAEDFEFERDEDLAEVLAHAFIRQVRRCTRGGLLLGYQLIEESDLTVRGQIRLSDQLRLRQNRLLPVEVSYDRITEDVEENRIIKAALFALRQLPLRHEETRRELYRLHHLFRNVTAVRYAPSRLPRIVFHRLNRHYRPSVELAKLILQSTSFEMHFGQTNAASFLVDMNKVLEDFVVTALRETLGLGERILVQGAVGRKIRMDVDNSVELRPDLSWWQDDRCLFVGDVKYKRVSIDGILHPDLYQLLAYVTALNLPSGVLIYSAGEAVDAEHVVRHSGKRLRVVSIDVSGRPCQILEDVERLAELVRSMAGVSSAHAPKRTIETSSKA
jgi:5-methylcytosine-specific restriction enzyme subunit McrC